MLGCTRERGKRQKEYKHGKHKSRKLNQQMFVNVCAYMNVGMLSDPLNCQKGNFRNYREATVCCSFVCIANSTKLSRKSAS